MKTISKVLVSVLGCAILASPAWAQPEKACLQHNRAQSWKAIDDRTIVYTDRLNNAFTVTFRDTCRNLTRGDAVLVNRNWSGLQCLSEGDAFRVGGHGVAASTCRVASVHAGAPGAPAG